MLRELPCVFLGRSELDLRSLPTLKDSNLVVVVGVGGVHWQCSEVISGSVIRVDGHS